MSKCVDLDAFVQKFLHLEQKVTELKATKQMLEARLEDTNKVLQFHLSKNKGLGDERDGLLVSVNTLQQSLQEQCHLRVEINRLKTEMADLKQQSKKREESKEAEVKKLLKMKDVDLQILEERLKNQEKERQNELLQLQMEFGAKLARVQTSAQWSQQQQQQQGPHGPGLLPHTVFKRKLHFFQEEKNREIVALRQRIKELEENQNGYSHLKKRRT